jgi:hypothetical protein
MFVFLLDAWKGGVICGAGEVEIDSLQFRGKGRNVFLDGRFPGSAHSFFS